MLKYCAPRWQRAMSTTVFQNFLTPPFLVKPYDVNWRLAEAIGLREPAQNSIALWAFLPPLSGSCLNQSRNGEASWDPPPITLHFLPCLNSKSIRKLDLSPFSTGLFHITQWKKMREGAKTLGIRTQWSHSFLHVSSSHKADNAGHGQSTFCISCFD